MARWRRPGRSTNGAFALTVEVPANTHATIRLPRASVERGDTRWQAADAVATASTGTRQDGADVVVDVGSGQYQFAYALHRCRRLGSQL